jgi:hypothetical protein
MSASRTAYWREYNRRNAAKKREQYAAFRERNKDKINADKRAARAARAKEFQNAFANMSGDQKVGFIESKRAMSEHFADETNAIRSSLGRSRRDRESAQKSAEGKAEALLTLREKFAAFRAAKHGGTNE